MNWINENSMSRVLLRHYPELAPALRGVNNPFTPWNTVGPHILAEEEPVALGRLSARETLMWYLRRGFWNHLMTFKYRGDKPSTIPVPVADSPITLVPLSEKFPAIPVRGVFVADRVPNDEARGQHRVKTAFSHFQAMLTRLVPPTQPGLPPVPADPVAALDRAYTKAHRKLFPAPVRPKETTLGQLAVASPYACYLQRTPDGGFRWDLSVLRNFEVHPGLVRLGAVVDFRLDPGGGGLEATRIESELGTHVPGDPKWMAATRLAMCSLTNHASLVRHFNWLHLTCGGPLAVVTRSRLPADHHVRRFLWPHVYGTQFSNAMVTPILMSKGGDFESVFSFTHAGLCRLFEFTTAEFDLGKINPLVDAARRGVADLGRTAVVQQNNEALFKIFSDHARRYLSRCYDSDDSLANDQEFGAWANELGQRLPHGVGAVMPDGSGLDGAAQLLATLAYMASIEHEMTGSGLWDYQLWNDVSPVRIYEHGLREPLDVSQRLVNANFNLNVHRTMLLQDFSGLAVDNVRGEAFGAFYRDLCDYQAVLDRSAPAPWRLEPKRLKANINA